MSKETIDLMVEGGKAVAGPAVGQKLGPMKINIADVLAEVNKKTESFKGMQVPVKLIIDTETKTFDVEVGTPPTSELIKKELKIDKGLGEPNKTKVGNLSIEQVIKIVKMKNDSMYTGKIKSAVKSVIGTANSMGILVEGKQAPDLIPKIDGGKFGEEIEQGKTETPEEKVPILNQQLEQVKVDLEKEFEKLKEVEEAEKAAVEEVPAEEVKEGEVPAEGEKPAEGEATPKEGEKPAEAEAPKEEKKE